MTITHHEAGDNPNRACDSTGMGIRMACGITVANV
jgi:hypothetical protein